MAKGMDKETTDKFLAEYEELCKKYEITVGTVGLLKEVNDDGGSITVAHYYAEGLEEAKTNKLIHFLSHQIWDEVHSRMPHDVDDDDEDTPNPPNSTDWGVGKS